MDLKSEKEAFVSGLEGTSIGEIYLVTVTLLAGYLLRCTLLVCMGPVYRAVSSRPLAGFLLEYLTIILPAVLVFTVLADYAWLVLMVELLLCGVLVAWKLASTASISLHHPLQSNFPSRHPYLTVIRTFVNLFTAVAILAVDFSIYPRRFAKAELYGSGLMDIGVGAFLMAHGVTSPEARERPSSESPRQTLKDPDKKMQDQKVVSSLRLIAVTLRQILPLFVLGFVRLVSVKSTGYQEHVTEYGVHWNFFFTIATVRVSFLFFREGGIEFGHFEDQPCDQDSPIGLCCAKRLLARLHCGSVSDAVCYSPPTVDPCSMQPWYCGCCPSHPLPSPVTAEWLGGVCPLGSRWGRLQGGSPQCKQRGRGLLHGISGHIHWLGASRQMALQTKVKWGLGVNRGGSSSCLTFLSFTLTPPPPP